MDGAARTQDKRDIVDDALRDHRAAFEGFVRARVRPAHADDVLQLAALRAMERADALEDPDRVVAWLYRIHRNIIIDVGRQLARERDVFDASATVPEPADEPATGPSDSSVSLAKRINPNYASILALVDSDGLQLREAAQALDVTVNNATVRLHRARQALKREMLEHCGVSSPQDCADCRCVYEACCAA
ncbi:MAG: sigma-70 family RNA polymerase sigma factor [Actinomycetota bacterium]